MITIIRGVKVFYKHFLYGSALAVASIISYLTQSTFTWVHMLLIGLGTLLMLTSAMITYAVYRYPEDFQDVV